jgi:hypothetical protein
MESRVFVSIFLGFVFDVVAIVSSQISTPCDNVDLMGLNISDWLLGQGIAGVVLIIFSLIAVISMIFDLSFSKIFSLFVLLLTGIFCFCWFIVGAIVLFRSNISCIHIGVPVACYAVFLWAFLAFNMCCSTPTTKESSV